MPEGSGPAGDRRPETPRISGAGSIPADRSLIFGGSAEKRNDTLAGGRDGNGSAKLRSHRPPEAGRRAVGSSSGGRLAKSDGRQKILLYCTDVHKITRMPKRQSAQVTQCRTHSHVQLETTHLPPREPRTEPHQEDPNRHIYESQHPDTNLSQSFTQTPTLVAEQTKERQP